MERDRLFQRAVLTVETDNFASSGFCVLLQGFLVLLQHCRTSLSFSIFILFWLVFIVFSDAA